MAASNRVRATALKLSLLVASTLVSLAIAEAAFRAHNRRARHESRSDDAWYERLRRMNRTIYRRSDDPRLVYEPTPSSAVPMPYGPAGFNAAQMRDDREHGEAPGERTRVAVLGDSIVWGEDVALEDSVPRQVEVALGAERAEVLNFGVTGYDTEQEAVWYERAVRRFHPGILVLVYCLNDALIMSGPYNRYATPEEARRKDAQDAYFDRVAPLRAETLEDFNRRDEAHSTLTLLARARGVWRARSYERGWRYRDEYTLTYARPERVARVRDALAALGRALARDGVRAHLVISPILRPWDRYHWSGIHALVADAGRAAGFEVHDPWTAWRAAGERPERLRLPGDSLHYDPRGNRVLGQYIAQVIRADVARAPRAAAP